MLSSDRVTVPPRLDVSGVTAMAGAAVGTVAVTLVCPCAVWILKVWLAAVATTWNAVVVAMLCE